MAQHFRTTRRIEFRETDAAGIVHFSAFFSYMEEAEHALLRLLGTSVITDGPEGKVSWPRVAAACEFTGTAVFEDVLDVDLWVAHLGTKSVRYAVRLMHEGRAVAEGSLTAVCCRIEPGGGIRSIPIPESLRRQLADYHEPDGGR